MTYTERMVAILKMIFDKEDISTELLSSVMLAFADGAPITDEMTSTEIGEMISRNWIETTQRQMIATLKAYNRMLQKSSIDDQTLVQIGDLL